MNKVKWKAVAKEQARELEAERRTNERLRKALRQKTNVAAMWQELYYEARWGS